MEFDSSDEEGREAELFRLKKLQSKKAHHCAKKDETFVMKQFQSFQNYYYNLTINLFQEKVVN